MLHPPTRCLRPCDWTAAAPCLLLPPPPQPLLLLLRHERRLEGHWARPAGWVLRLAAGRASCLVAPPPLPLPAQSAQRHAARPAAAVPTLVPPLPPARAPPHPLGRAPRLCVGPIRQRLASRAAATGSLVPCAPVAAAEPLMRVGLPVAVALPALACRLADRRLSHTAPCPGGQVGGQAGGARRCPGARPRCRSALLRRAPCCWAWRPSTTRCCAARQQRSGAIAGLRSQAPARAHPPLTCRLLAAGQAQRRVSRGAPSPHPGACRSPPWPAQPLRPPPALWRTAGCP